jgi:putative methanogenesis marker protein 8
MSRVVIEDGKVVEVGEPQIKFCPLFKKYRNIDEITPDIVKENIEFRIGSFGMCSGDREIRMKDFLSFGISEILSSALKHGAIDAAVIAADGCGTVIVNDPEIVQGLGGRISGLCETSPISSVIDGVGRDNVLDPDTAAMDALRGIRKAKSMGFSRVAVTVVSMEDADSIRKEFGDGAIIMAVHTSGTSEEDACVAFDVCDVVTACASEHIRNESKNRDLLIAGNRIPVYGVSDKGRELIMMRLEEINKEPRNGSEPEIPPHPLI